MTTQNGGGRPGAALLMSVAVLSAAVLAYEIALVSLLAITHWTHFAAMVISLALLGFGASGSALAVLGHRIAGRERRAYTALALLAALSFDPAYRLAALVPFDAFELIAVPRQLVWLAVTYVVLALPFFFGGAAIALALAAARDGVSRVYAANLAGSGAGAVAGLALLAWLPAEALPAAIGVLGLAALAPLWRWGALLPAAGLAAALVLPRPDVPVSMYKEGSLAARLPEARVTARRDGPLGRLERIESPALRTLPGASLTLTEPVPARPVLYLNGQALGPRATEEDARLWAVTTSAAAYALAGPRARVLVVGLGGGAQVVLARAAGARSITVVDPDSRIDALLDPGIVAGVRRVRASPRGWLHGRDERFDRIVIGEVGSLGGSAAGMAGAGADWLFTVEGFRDLWHAVDREGAIAITRWALDPPRDAPRLLATIRRVLDEEGLEAGRHVAVVRSWSTVTLLVSRRPLAPRDVAALQGWSEAHWFDLAWAPGAPAALANRYHILEPDRFRLAADGLLGPEPEEFLDRYAFDVEPVEDDAPFFHHFLRARDLARLWRAEGRLSLPYVEWGVVAHWLVLLHAIPVAAALILLPLIGLRRRREPVDDGGRARWMFLYFALLGLAFMLLEISAIQRLDLLLAQPLYATTVVIASFLVFAGLGSAVAPRLARRGRWIPFLAIAGLAILARLAEELTWEVGAGAPLAARVAAAVAILAPLAFAMGLPFPIGLQRVATERPRWLPWCWGVNGFLSVVGAAAAPLAALALGFDGVLLLAVGLYLAAGATLPRV